MPVPHKAILASCAPLLIALIALIAFANSLQNGFVHDDVYFIERNTAIQTLAHPLTFFIDPNTISTSFPWKPLYRPLRTLSFAMDYHFWGRNPFGFHLTNLILHIIASVLVLRLMKRTLANDWAALLTALFFAVHPVQTEAVSWVSSRGDLLSAVLLLAALLLVTGASQGAAPGAAHTWFGIACFAGAMLGKESAIVLPVLVVAYDRLITKSDLNRRRMIVYAAMAATAIGYFMARLHVLRGNLAQQDYWGGGFLATVSTMLRVAVVYIRLVMAPVRLTVEYPFSISYSPLEARVLGSFLLLSAIAAIVWVASRRDSRIAFFALWFVICLAPVSNMIPITALMAERFLYLPLIGALGLAGMAWQQLTKLRYGTLAGSCLAAVLLAACLLQTITRNADWRDELSLWRATVGVSPSSPKAQHNLANALIDQNKLDEALQHIQRALELDPHYAVAYATRGKILARQNHFKEAVPDFTTALQTLSHIAWIHNELGATLAKLGKVSAAEAEFRQALKLQPEQAETYVRLAMLTFERHEAEGAERLLGQALRIDPNSPEALNGEGILTAEKGRLSDAEKLFLEALQQAPNYQEARANLQRVRTMMSNQNKPQN